MGNSEFLILLYSVAIIFAITFGYVNPYSPYSSSALFAPLICYIGGIAIRSASNQQNQQQTPNSSDNEYVNNNNDTIINSNNSIPNNNNNIINNINNSTSNVRIKNNRRNNSSLDQLGSDLSELNHHSSLSSGISSSLGQMVSDFDIMNELINANPSHSLNKYQQQQQQQQQEEQREKERREKEEKLKKEQQLLLQQQQQQQQQQWSSMSFENQKTNLKNVARVYKDVNENQVKEYYDYENYRINWKDCSRYEIVQKIGRGKYSEVFSGVDMDNNEEEVVIKVLKPVQKLKIQREIKILESLNGGTNIIPLLDYVKDPLSKVCSLVFPYVNKTDIRELVNYLEDYDIRYYMYELLKAIDYTHSKGIIHRDIKPLNIAIDHSKRKLFLLDWGLAEYYHPYKNYNVRVASRHYKPPELLVNMYDYDYSLDMWSFGCLFAGLILDRDPFFAGENNNGQLAKIVKVLGTDDLYKFLDKFGLSLNDEQIQLIGKPRQKSSWERFIPYENEDIATPDAIDFLDKLLRYDPTERLTAKEAMEHPYFNILKSKNNSFVINK